MLLALLSLLFFLFSLAASGHALLNKRDSRSALGWVAVCLLVPYAGAILYLLFGVNRARSSARRLRPVTSTGLRSVWKPESAQLRHFPLAVIGHNITRSELVPVDNLEVLRNGDEAYPAMLAAIAEARKSVWLSTYIFSRGRVADAFIAALKAARERGVDVRILLDGMGEYMGLPRIGPRLRRAGLTFVRFNPLRLLPLSLHLNLRNHRKLLIIDRSTAFTGGMNIADGNHHAEGLRHTIQDLHFRLNGPITEGLANVFLQDWHYAFREEPRPQDAGPVPLPARSPAWSVEDSEATAFGRIITDGPNEDIDKIADSLVGVFSCARTRIWIMTPYFLPDTDIVGALQAACLRNLDVRVILPSGNNIPAAHRASRHQLWQVLNYGVKVYYQSPPFNHSKLLLIDDDYIQLGSANLDPRSLRLNFELNLEIFSREVHQTLCHYYEQCMAKSASFTRYDLRRRSLLARLTDAICWLFSPYL